MVISTSDKLNYFIITSKKNKISVTVTLNYD